MSNNGNNPQRMCLGFRWAGPNVDAAWNTLANEPPIISPEGDLSKYFSLSMEMSIDSNGLGQGLALFFSTPPGNQFKFFISCLDKQIPSCTDQCGEIQPLRLYVAGRDANDTDAQYNWCLLWECAAQPYAAYNANVTNSTKGTFLAFFPKDTLGGSPLASAPAHPSCNCPGENGGLQNIKFAEYNGNVAPYPNASRHWKIVDTDDNDVVLTMNDGTWELYFWLVVGCVDGQCPSPTTKIFIGDPEPTVGSGANSG